MEAKAQARYVRVTPMKARRVVDLIRGREATQALAVLEFAPQAASAEAGGKAALVLTKDTRDPVAVLVDALADDVAAEVEEGRLEEQVGDQQRVRRTFAQSSFQCFEGAAETASFEVAEQALALAAASEARAWQLFAPAGPLPTTSTSTVSGRPAGRE